MPSADVVVGGFPCQGFSMANMKRNIDDERNVLYKFFYNAIKEKQPKFFIAENVKGILSLGKGSVVNQIKTDFEDAGYIVEVHKVNMADYGVPQHRERVLFIGQRKDLGTNMIFSFPNPTNSKLGNAVCRNKVKRQLRSIVDDIFKFEEGYDLIIIVRPAYANKSFEENKNEMKENQNRINKRFLKK